jgi:hypothetical protein
MGGHIAVARFPFGGGFGTGAAEPTGRKFNFTAAAVTRFHGFMTDTAIVRTALGGHERTFLIFANGCTKQGYHLLRDILKKRAGSCIYPAQSKSLSKPPEHKLSDRPCQHLFNILGHSLLSAHSNTSLAKNTRTNQILMFSRCINTQSLHDSLAFFPQILTMDGWDANCTTRMKAPPHVKA